MKKKHQHIDTGPGRGGHRAGAGRRPKPDKEEWGRISCILRHETIALLREGARSTHVGDFLQRHLDRFPLPTFSQDQEAKHYRNAPILRAANGQQRQVIRVAGSSYQSARPTRRRRILSDRRLDKRKLASGLNALMKEK